MNTTADKKDREITLQFSFTNEDAIPGFLDNLPICTAEKDTVHQRLTTKGIDLTGGKYRGKKVDLRGLPAGLLHSDYVLVGVWKQTRIQDEGHLTNHPYWMIRFRFRHKDHLAEYRQKIDNQVWQEIEKKRTLWLGELVTICSLAFWQARAYRNQWFQDGKILPDVSFISLNFEGRQPLYEDSRRPENDEELPQQHKADFILNIG